MMRSAPTGEIPIADALEAFLAPRRALGHSQAAMDKYRWAVERVSLVASCLPITTDELVSALTASDYKLESTKGLVQCWRTFFSFVEHRYGFRSPVKELPDLSRKRTLPRVLSPREITQLVDACESERDLLLVLVALDTGLRLAEIAGMRPGSIDDCWLTVNGKFGDRTVVISPEIVDRLELIGDAEHYWLGQRGPLSRHGVQEVYRRLFEKAGIAGWKNGPHALRHSFAVQWIRAGGGVPQLQLMMGHKSIETTMVYVNLANRDMLDSHRVYSPARRLGYIDDLANSLPMPQFRDHSHPGARLSTVAKYPRIRRLARQGVSRREIAERLKVSRDTVRTALAGADGAQLAV